MLSNERITLQIIGRKAKVSFIFSNIPLSDWPQFEFLNLAYALSTFQSAAGTNAALDEIHLQNFQAPNLDVVLPSGNDTKVFLGQPVTSIIFSTDFLSCPMLKSHTNTNPNPTIPAHALSTSDSITAIFDNWAAKPRMDLIKVSDTIGMTPRSLQRRLSEENKTFKEIIDHWRFSKSLDLICDTDMTINEISEYLGYANTPNFDRAFRRWTGVSPTKYRDSS